MAWASVILASRIGVRVVLLGAHLLGLLEHGLGLDQLERVGALVDHAADLLVADARAAGTKFATVTGVLTAFLGGGAMEVKATSSEGLRTSG